MHPHTRHMYTHTRARAHTHTRTRLAVSTHLSKCAFAGTTTSARNAWIWCFSDSQWSTFAESHACVNRHYLYHSLFCSILRVSHCIHRFPRTTIESLVCLNRPPVLFVHVFYLASFVLHSDIHARTHHPNLTRCCRCSRRNRLFANQDRTVCSSALEAADGSRLLVSLLTSTTSRCFKSR